MREWSHSVRSSKWSWLATCLLACAVAAGIVAADPGSKKKAPAAAQSPTSGGKQSVSPGETAKSGIPAAVTSEPIVARVNNDVITYKQLAEECIARKGADVLETMIAKTLVMQACRARGIRVTPAEIDEEIGRTAQRFGTSRESFLKMLKEEQKLDGKRYAEDIVMPGLALKKLASPLVKVSDEDIERGFEAHYGEKMKCRWIVVNELKIANDVWNELRNSSKTGDAKVELPEFERAVTKYSMDVNSRAVGGQIQPISKHTGPTFQTLERAAFALKEDGEISPVVQMANSYVILYREKHIPPLDVKLEAVRAKLEAEIYDTKLREQIAGVFQELQKEATIENLLTGDVSMPDNTAVTGGQPQKTKREPVNIGKQDAPKKTQPTMKR
jgi:foldase protein PrsA